MITDFDAIVIGGGHNGLVAAAMLARKGLKTILLEARSHLGGLVGDDAFRVAPLPHGLHPQVARTLGIDLAMKPVETVTAVAGREPLRVSGGTVTGASTGDAARFADMHARLARQAAALSGMITREPPGFGSNGWGQLLALGKTALKLRGLGKSELRELMRIALSNVADLASDELGDMSDGGALAGMLALDATLGGAMGPRSPGTVLPLLWRMAAESGFGKGVRAMPTGGPQALVQALSDAASRAGVQVHMDARVAAILVEQDRVAGVRLESGKIVRAPRIVSGAAPGPTLLGLLGVKHLDAEFVRRCRTVANNGMVARIDFDLKDIPLAVGSTRLEDHHRLVVAPDIAMVERAFNRAKYGDVPAAPPLEAHLDSARGRLEVSVQFVPAKAKWSDKMRKSLEEAVLAQLATALTDIRRLVRSSRIMTPADIEMEYFLPGGHWHHVEFRVDQLLMLRPFDGAAHYRMPVGGLYLCSAATHPGGDISGAPGFNAANVVLADVGL